MNQNAFKDKGPEPMFPACVSLGNMAALGTSQGEPLYIPLPQPFPTVRPFVLGEGRGGESGGGGGLITSSPGLGLHPSLCCGSSQAEKPLKGKMRNCGVSRVAAARPAEQGLSSC